MFAYWRTLWHKVFIVINHSSIKRKLYNREEKSQLMDLNRYIVQNIGIPK